MITQLGVISSSKEEIPQFPYAIFGGGFSAFKKRDNSIVKLKPDGSKDETFDTGYGLSRRTGGSDGSLDMGRGIIDSNGKLMYIGSFTNYYNPQTGPFNNRVIRINPTDGSKDTSFNMGSGFNSSPYRVREYGGKYYFVGAFTTYNGVTVNRIVRVNQDGSEDTSFDMGTGFNNVAYDLDFQSDGKIIVGGSFTTYNGTSVNRFCRLNTDGSLDLTFNIGSGPNNAINCIEVDSNDNIYITGFLTTYSSGGGRVHKIDSNGGRIWSYYTGNANFSITLDESINSVYVGSAGGSKLYKLDITLGSLDNTFYSALGSGFDGQVKDVDVVSGGKLYVLGQFNNFNGSPNKGLIKLNSDGTKDTSFDNSDFLISASNYGNIMIDGSENIYVHSRMTLLKRYHSRIASITSGATVDDNFDAFLAFNNRVYDIVLDESAGSRIEKIYAGGAFTSHRGITYNRMVRMLVNGDIDTNFNIGDGFDSTIRTIAINSTNNLYVGGQFTTYDGNSHTRIVSLYPDGSVNTTSNFGTGFNNTVRRIIFDSSDKMYIGGQFTDYNGTTINRIVRLNIDGSIDSGFDVGTGFNNTVNDMKIDGDGKLVVGGSFTDYNGTTVNRIVRLNTDGTIDNTFTPTLNNTVQSLDIQSSDGKIVCGGNFTSPASRIVRLNTDGSRDTSFNAPNPNGTCYVVRLDSQERTIAWTTVSSYNHVMRLNKSNGSRDTSFNTYFGADGFNSNFDTVLLK